MAESSPKMLVFSTENVSDPEVDLAGRNKMHYPASVFVINVTCSSGIKPKWIVHALENGFDGVFIAADGSDCDFDVMSRIAPSGSAKGEASAGAWAATGHQEETISLSVGAIIVATGFESYQPKRDKYGFGLDGVYIAGACQGTKNSTESVAVSLSAVSKAAALLVKGYVDLQPFVTYVMNERCIGRCGSRRARVLPLAQSRPARRVREALASYRLGISDSPRAVRRERLRDARVPLAAYADGGLLDVRVPYGRCIQSAHVAAVHEIRAHCVPAGGPVAVRREIDAQEEGNG
jgi:hypothetical protein